MTKRQRAAPQRGTFIFGILDAGAHLAKEMFADERQDDAQQFADDQRIRNQEFNREEAEKARQWAEHMSNTQHQRTIKDLAAAGLNPMLAYMKGQAAGVPTAAAASGGMASAGIASPSGGTNIAAGMQSASQIAVNDALEQRTRAEADRVRAETKEIEARTPTHAVSIDRMRQEIDESIERMKRITEETKHHASSARHLDQQVINLQAEIPRIGALVDQLRAQAKLTTQETKTSAASEHRHYIESGRAGAQDEETRQRIRANLPALEAAYKELQNQLAKLKTPQAGMQAATHSSFLGAWNAALRALLGMESK